jgi:hypothetical protein
MKNSFNKQHTNEFISRINLLTPTTQPKWGKMSVVQMLAHCNVSYEMIFDNKLPKANAVKKFILKLLVKNLVVSEKPYKKGSPTAPQFLIKDTRNFEVEKNRLIAFIHQVQELGENYFDGKESHSFGKLNKQEWKNMLSKHLDHHLTQFGV